MARIALGSDHRGGKIAQSLLSRIWFRNQEYFFGKKTDPIVPFVGAVEFTSLKSTRSSEKFVGSDLEFILTSDEIKSNEGYSNGNGSLLCHADYPDVAAVIAEKVGRGQIDRGILICGTGIGMCVVANKFPGVRAAFCHSELTAELSRMHNDANVLCLSGEMIGESAATEIVLKWLQTDYIGGRHQNRIDKISAIEARTGL